MGAVVSIIVCAIGAILRFATNVQSSTFNIKTIGDILMIVGVVGFVLSIAAFAYWDGLGARSRRHRTVVHEQAPPVYGPNGYARTTYPDYRPAEYDPTRQVGTIVEEEERSTY